MDLTLKKLSSLQEISKAQLSKILSSVPGPKNIVLEASIIRPLEKVCGVKWLKGNGIERIYKLEPNAPSFGLEPIFYMIFSNWNTFKQVVDQIRSKIEAPSVENKFHIILVPSCLHYYQNELEELGLYSIIKLHYFQWMPLHLDIGILSLELQLIYRSLFLHLDNTFVPSLSRSLWYLFFVTGRPKFILTLGDISNRILNQLELFIENKGDSDKNDSDFGGLLILDRSVDYPSPLLTPGTYSGLINEVYGTNCGICEYKSQNETDSLNPKKQSICFQLDSIQDSIYCDIKNRYFTEVTSVLCALTKQLKNEKVQDMALDEIKTYVKTQLQATKVRKKLITNHLLAAESIINSIGGRFEQQHEIEGNILRNINKNSNLTYLEESLCVENDPCVVLRIFCLICLCQKLSESEIKSFWRKFLHQFGFHNAGAYINLVNSGFISENNAKLRLKFGSNEFNSNANKLKQIPANPEKINLKHPTCASFVFGGNYIPLVTQAAALILNSTPLDEIKAKLGSFGVLSVRNEMGFPLQTRSLLIFIVGGVSYAEIAACNLLETLTGARIVLFSDRIISGNDLMRDVLS